MAHNLEFDIDYDNKQITVKRRYHASQQKVYEAWTTTAWLDRWWAPKPYQVETKHMDFSVGGYWLYAMVSPEGEKHWCRADYESIKAPESFRTAMRSATKTATLQSSRNPIGTFGSMRSMV